MSATASTGAPRVRPVTMSMRRGLLVIAVGVIFAGASAFFLSGNTHRFFSWTIAPSLTAAFIGASYCAGFPMLVLCARETVWVRARVVVPATMLIGVAILIVTLIHIDKFHMRAVTGWSWLILNIALGPGLFLLLMRQLREPGYDPPRTGSLPSWLMALLGVEAVVLIGFGAPLLFAPVAAKAPRAAAGSNPAGALRVSPVLLEPLDRGGEIA